MCRGLPSEFWEPEMRRQAVLNQTKTIKLHEGFPFYEEPIPRSGADAGPLSALLPSRTTFRRNAARSDAAATPPS